LIEADQYNVSNTLLQKVGFLYDAFGNRIQKQTDPEGDGDWDTTQRYALDGWNPALAAKPATPTGTSGPTSTAATT
jgi:hypothetical protein